MEKSIGQILKQTRLSKKISLDEVHKQARISLKFLEALEGDKPEDFPAEVYFLGFLRQYAKFLGLNAEELVQQYQRTRPPKEAHVLLANRKVLLSTKPQKYSYVLFLVLLVFFSLSVLRLKSYFAKKEKPAPIPERSPSVSVAEQVKNVLEVKALEDTWVRIIADSELVYEKILSTGTVKSWQAKEKFHIRIGNTRGVEMKLNGEPVDITTGSQGLVNEFDLPRKEQEKIVK